MTSLKAGIRVLEPTLRAKGPRPKGLSRGAEWTGIYFGAHTPGVPR